MTKTRITGKDIEEAAARAWDKYPKALGIAIRYLYHGWYELQVIKSPQR